MHDSCTSAQAKSMKEKLTKEAKKRGLMVLLYLLSAAVITALLIPSIRKISTPEGRLALKASVDHLGPFAPLLYIALQTVQIVLAFIPGEPVEILGGMLFGSILGCVYALIGVFCGTILVFLLVRKFGKPFVSLFFSEEQMNGHRLLRDERRLESLVFLLFLVPGTPKDLLTYLVPLTKIDGKKYLMIATFARIPSLITSTIVGASLGDGHFLFSLIMFLATAVIGLLGIWLNHRCSEQKKKTENTKKDDA